MKRRFFFRTMSGKFDTEQDSEMVFETSTDVKVVSSFDQMGLKDDLVRGIYAYSTFS
jgi:ATP-dependent RNA helicase